MRDFIDLVEAASLLPPTELYHGTSAPIQGDSFKPLTHFGSVKAALRRSRLVYGPCYIYKVHLSASSPLRIRDGNNWNHSPMKLADILFYTVKAITDDERYQLFQYHDEEIMKAKIIEIVSAKGYDSFVYKNVHEDAGHDSWMNFHEHQVTILDEPHILTMQQCFELE